ncbi:MAG: chemotaxis protein CheC [Chloroflexi bacterium]|nr:chemotaxis protein CheC [Chloroflexota bacterium]
MISLTGALQDGQWRALRDVAARGTTNAAAGLSEMVGRNIRIQTPDVFLVRLGEVAGLLGGPEDTVVGVYLAICGDVRGHILLMFSPREAEGLVDMVMDQAPGTTTSLGTMERSALGEVGNLTGTFFLNALAEVTRLNMQPSPPAVMVDMGTAVLDVPLAALATSADESLVIKTVFLDDQRRIEAAFLVMPDMPSLQAILEVLEKRWRIR